jgi:hypothetical protein
MGEVFENECVRKNGRPRRIEELGQTPGEFAPPARRSAWISVAASGPVTEQWLRLDKAPQQPSGHSEGLRHTH